jgi:hypothetical protein
VTRWFEKAQVNLAPSAHVAVKRENEAAIAAAS